MPDRKLFTHYPEVIEYLYGQLAYFQHSGAKALKPGLKNIRLLCEHLGQPHLKFPSIHIAGTNGKGSTANMIAAVLQSAGYKTGLYTSPHLKSFTERIRIQGIEIPEREVLSFVNKNLELIENIQPSFFETTVAMAFQYFAQEEVDVAVIEVGMGGRLDSTNIIHPVLSVITNISYDHQAFLGETLQEIAAEKAGIIKENTPVVISQYQEEVFHVFEAKARSCDADLFLATKGFHLEYSKEVESFQVYKKDELYLSNLRPDLKGEYQQKNLLGVLQSLEILIKLGWQIRKSDIREGIELCTMYTGFKGRWQILHRLPLTICDIAHNEDGILEVFQQIKHLNYKNLHIITGFSKDKDIKKMLAIYPSKAFYYFCHYNSPRALNAYTLKETAQSAGLSGKAFESVGYALQEAQNLADKNDLILILGSAYIIAELAEI